jgi:predicted phage terminase large subunit-like protein
MTDYSVPPEFTSVDEFVDQTNAHLLNIPFCPWRPHEGAQAHFLLDLSREAFFGGAAGPGKSVALLMAASQFLHVPDYAALLLRKTYPDLHRPGALMALAEGWWAGRPGVRFDREQHTYHFACPGGGESTITFGSLDNRNDKYKYQGGAFAFIGFDELTQFPESDYTYLFSRLRKAKGGPLEHLPPRMRATSNPGGVNHEWVYTRFVAPSEAWWARKGPEPQRSFHPATLADNPSLDVDDYKQSLAELDPVTRAQLLKGDWHIRPDGRMFNRAWFKPIERQDVPGNCRWVRAWDMAATEPVAGSDPDYTVGLLMGRDPQGRFYIPDIRRFREGPAKTDELCKAIVDRDTHRVTQLMEQEPGSAGKAILRHYRTGPFAAASFKVVASSGKSRGRVSVIEPGRYTPRSKILAAGPLASDADAGEVFVVMDGSWDHEAFLSELEIFPDGMHDDCADAASLAHSYLASNPVIAPRFDTNEDLRGENYWAPPATSWAPGWEEDLTRRVGQGEQAVRSQARSREELAAKIAEIWHQM